MAEVNAPKGATIRFAAAMMSACRLFVAPVTAAGQRALQGWRR